MSEHVSCKKWLVMPVVFLMSILLLTFSCYQPVSAQVTDGAVMSAVGRSAALVLPSKQKLKITKQPSNVKVWLGEQVTLNIEAKGEGTLSYQWQYMDRGSKNWTDWGTDARFTTTDNADKSWNGRRFRCIVTDSDNNSTITSSVRTISVPRARKALSVTALPVSVKAKDGERPVFSVKATGEAPLHYQWQYKLKGTEEWIDGAKTSSYRPGKMSSSLDGAEFKCIVTDTDGYSQAASTTCTLKYRLLITTQPSNMKVWLGENATLTAKAKGEGTLSYKWQYMDRGSKEWTDWCIGSMITTSDKADKSWNGRRFRCVVTDLNDNSTITSSVRTISVPRARKELSVTALPVSVKAKDGERPVFSVKATGEAPLHYQWQYKLKGTNNWIYCAQTSSYRPGKMSSSLDGAVFKCTVMDTDRMSQKDSTECTLKYKLLITKQPSNVSVRIGETTKFGITATGEGELRYQWQYYDKAQKVWTGWGSESTENTYTTEAADSSWNGRRFRCVVKDSDDPDNPIISSACTIRTLPERKALTIIQQPTDLRADAGDRVVLNIKATGEAPLHYQWQYHLKDDAGWTDWGTTASYRTGKVLDSWDGLVFRCVVTDTDKVSSVTSNECTLRTPKVLKKLTITEQPTDMTVLVGDTPQLSISASGEGVTYQWQYRLKGDKAWQDWGTENPCTLAAVTKAWDGLSFRCAVKDKEDNKLISDVCDMRVQTGSKLMITSQPKSVATSVGQNATISVTAQGEGLSYQWYILGSGNTWSKVGDNSSELTVKVSACIRPVYKCIISDSNGNSVETAIAEIAIAPEGSHFVTFDANGGSFTTDSTTKKIQCVCSTDSLSSGDYGLVEREGYGLLGWSTKKNADVAEYAVDNLQNCKVKTDMTLYAVWTDSAYKVTVDYNGGVGYGQAAATKKLYYIAKGCKVTYEVGYSCFKTDYVLIGWAKESNAQKAEYDECLMNYTPQSDITLYAVWAQEVKVNFDANGGYFGYGTDYQCSVQKYTVAKGQRLWNNHPSTFAGSTDIGHSDGAAFIGWYFDKEGTQPVGNISAYVPEADITVYAKWGDGYKVVLNANGGTNSDYDSSTLQTFIVSKGSSIGIDFFDVRNGYIQVGWSENKNAKMGDTGVIDARSLYSYIPKKDITLYAVWSPKITITYNANGGTWESTNISDDTYCYIAKGKALNTSQPGLVTREGYYLLGWSKNKNSAKANMSLDTVATSNMTLYAVWKKETGNGLSVPKVSFDETTGYVTVTNIVPAEKAYIGMTIYRDGARVSYYYPYQCRYTTASWNISNVFTTSGTYTFKVKAGYTVADAEALVNGAIGSTTYEYTMPDQKLDTPTGLKWEKTGTNHIQASWTSVENASQYGVFIKLANGEVMSSHVVNTFYDVSSIDAADLSTFYVVAYPGNITKYQASDRSVDSPDYSSMSASSIEKGVQLEAVTGLEFTDSGAGWKPVKNCDSYKVIVTCDDKEILNTETADTSITFDHSTAGHYKVTVTALGDGKKYFDSDEASVEKIVEAAANSTTTNTDTTTETTTEITTETTTTKEQQTTTEQTTTTETTTTTEQPITTETTTAAESTTTK